MPAVVASVLAANAALLLGAAAIAYMAGHRRGRRENRQEIARLTARLGTFTRILRPLPASLQLGNKGVRLPPEDLATLAILVRHPGPDGEQILALEATFNSPENP
ncbi:hypothetical protein [Streptosporangium sp. NPDC051022]|uniref:hypothetical protein n=1 Tax=Streptosporangium sp. NPDC051022 TaxID=3155752 RepID=UPI0034188235